MNDDIVMCLQRWAGDGWSPRVQFVLAHGRLWPPAPAPRPKGLRRGPAKACFKNASLRALDHPEWRYVEGYVAVGSPVTEHAWIVDEVDRVIETTLTGHGTAYFGVAFTLDALRKALSDSRCFCLLCHDSLPQLFARAKSIGVPVTELLE